MVLTKAIRPFDPELFTPTEEQIQQRTDHINALKAKAREIWPDCPDDDNILRDTPENIDGQPVKIVTRWWPNIEMATLWCEFMATDEFTTSCEIVPE
jgi:hypothetical protein